MSTKLNWNGDEQQYLREIVQNRKELTWNQIAEEMNKKFPQKCRTGKQYRQRFVNYIQFQRNNQIKNNWSIQEQSALFKAYQELGTKWTLISKIIPSKSENSLKNKFYGALRKTLRKINKIGKQNLEKFNKLIKYESVIRILQAAECSEDLPNNTKTLSIQIKQTILKLALHCEEQYQILQVADVIKKIHKFNILTRCYSSKKWKKNIQISDKNKSELSNNQTISADNTQENQRQDLDCQFLEKSGRKYLGNLQSLKRQQQQNLQIIKLSQQQQQDDIKNQYSVEDANLMDFQQELLYSEALQPMYKERASFNDDLELQVCQILHKSYIPQYFNYFEE